MNSNSDELDSGGGRPRRAAVAVIIREKRYLIVKRAANIRAPHQLCFPGGGIEEGESVNAALVRELQEELGVEVVPQKEIWLSRSSWGVDIHWVAAELAMSEVLLPNPAEVAEVHWMSVETILDCDNLLPSNREFFESHAAGKFTN